MRPLMTTIWNNLQGWLQENPDLEITIRPHKSKRSTEQNRRLWKIYQTLAEQAWVSGKQFSQDAWHEYCKRQFIGCEELPDGSQIGISTTTLNTGEMTDYQNRIQAWAAQEFGIIWEF